MSEWKLTGSGRPLTAEKQLRSQALLGWICGLQSGTEKPISPSTSVFPCQCHFNTAPYWYFIRYTILVIESVSENNNGQKLMMVMVILVIMINDDYDDNNNDDNN